MEWNRKKEAVLVGVVAGAVHRRVGDGSPEFGSRRGGSLENEGAFSMRCQEMRRKGNKILTTTTLVPVSMIAPKDPMLLTSDPATAAVPFTIQ